MARVVVDVEVVVVVIVIPTSTRGGKCKIGIHNIGTGTRKSTKSTLIVPAQAVVILVNDNLLEEELYVWA